MVLSGRFCPPGDTGQHLGTSTVIATRGTPGIEWLGPGMLLHVPQCPGHPPQRVSQRHQCQGKRCLTRHTLALTLEQFLAFAKAFTKKELTRASPVESWLALTTLFCSIVFVCCFFSNLVQTIQHMHLSRGGSGTTADMLTPGFVTSLGRGVQPGCAGRMA